jgi:hypothetical protein
MFVPGASGATGFVISLSSDAARAISNYQALWRPFQIAPGVGASGGDDMNKSRSSGENTLNPASAVAPGTM